MLRFMRWTNWIRRLLRAPYRLLSIVLKRMPAFRFIEETKDTAIPIDFDTWFRQQVLGVNYGPYWPVHPSSCVIGWRNIETGVEVAPGYTPGCYIQAIGEIRIGDYTRIAPNVGIISSNHDCEDGRIHLKDRVSIGKYCWIGMGAVILPGVTLGDFTIVGAGAIVTRSFPDGYCVIGGNPARFIKSLDEAKCVRFKNNHEYYGYIPKEYFAAYSIENGIKRSSVENQSVVAPAAPRKLDA